MWREKISGFYAVLDRDDEALARSLCRVARVLQVRLKPAPADAIRSAAEMARRVTRELCALLIINDDLDLALEVGADGVHLGQDDLSLAAARARTDMIIGISTHDLYQVRSAVAGGADYLGFGPVYATATKMNPDPIQGVAALVRAVGAAGQVPVVAIGGITPECAVEVAAAGAAAACAISAVNDADDPERAARRIAAAF